jgi:GTPase SAR1 family protein
LGYCWNRAISINDKNLLQVIVFVFGFLFVFLFMFKNLSRSAAVGIVCYDVTNAESFEKVKFWVKELQSYEENCIIVLTGTKSEF